MLKILFIGGISAPFWQNATTLNHTIPFIIGKNAFFSQIKKFLQNKKNTFKNLQNMLYKTSFIYYNKIKRNKEEKIILMFDFILSFKGIELRFVLFL